MVLLELENRISMKYLTNMMLQTFLGLLVLKAIVAMERVARQGLALPVFGVIMPTECRHPNRMDGLMCPLREF